MSANPNFKPQLADRSDSSPVMAARELRDVFGTFATGVTVITTSTHDGPEGMTVNSFSSVSLDPALVLWSVAKHSARCQLFANAAFFTVNILAEQQKDTALSFARDEDAFEHHDWQLGVFHSPVLAACVANLECRAYACYPGGDHTIVVGEVLQATINGGKPLVFNRGEFASLG